MDDDDDDDDGDGDDDDDRGTYVVLDPPSILELLLEHPEHHPHDKVLVGLSCEKEAVLIPNTEQSLPTLWKKTLRGLLRDGQRGRLSACTNTKNISFGKQFGGGAKSS